MYKALISLLFISMLVFTGKGALYAQPESEQMTTRILFVVDYSRSMLNAWGKTTKIDAAKLVMNEFVDSLKSNENVELALRLYGHQSPHTENDCRDSRLEVSFRKYNAVYIKRKLEEIRPKGITPIGYSLTKSSGDFPDLANSRNLIIMITDGVESCDMDPCGIIADLLKKNILLRTFVIGLGVEKAYEDQFECMGDFRNAHNAKDLKDIMRYTLNKILNTTSTRVDLLDLNKRATETDENMSFYDSASGIMKYNYYHTINARGNSDTIFLDPVINYTLQVHTIPPVTKKNIELSPDKKNIIQVDAPQGYLELVMEGISNKNFINCILFKEDQHRTLNVQEFNSTVKYLTGSYDLEILTLPRIKLKKIEIAQSKTTRIEIPAPGYITISRSFELYGAIFMMENNQMKEVYQLSENAYNETIGLQPGKYKVVYRSKIANSMKFSKEKDFTIKTGDAISLKL